jgi:apolipoprotein N-acyltransferase
LKLASGAHDSRMGMNPTVERTRIRHPRSEVLLELRRRELRRARQEFGGQIQWEAAFFGLLAAVGLAACLVATVLGGLIAAGVLGSHEDAAGLVDQMMAGGGAISVAILALSYLTGGYVAARMARFDGWRQGLGIWLLSLFVVLAAAITAWIAGGKLDPTESISLPSNPVGEGPLHQSDVVIAAVLVVVPLLAALIGGVLGDRFHRAVDRAGTEEFEAVPPPHPKRESNDEPEADTEVEEERTAEREEDTEPVVWQP